MATPAGTFATIIHLTATGHVLAAVSSVGAEPELKDLVVDEQLPVRLPGTQDFIDVPASLLTATRASLKTLDVLDRPHEYVLGSDDQTLEPASDLPPAKGKKSVFVWRIELDQNATESVVGAGPLREGGSPPRDPPAGATHALSAFEGGGLTIESLED